MKKIIIRLALLLLFTNLSYTQKQASNQSELSLYKKQLKLKELVNSQGLTKDEKYPYVIALADIYLQRGKLFNSLLVLNKVLDGDSGNELIPKHQAEVHLRLANTYDKIVDVENFLIQTEKFHEYYNLAYPNKKIYDALYFSYLSRYYSMRMLYDKAALYAEKSLTLFHQNKSDSSLIAVELIYLNQLFSLRNYSKDFDLKSKYRDTIENILEKKYLGYHTQKSEVIIGANMYLLDSLSHNYKKGYINNEGHKKLSSELITILENQINVLDDNIGFFNPYNSRYQALLGLIYFYNDDFDKSLIHYEKSVQRNTASNLLKKNKFSAHNFMLSNTLLWKAKSLNALFEKTKNIDYLLKNEENLNKLKIAWQLYIEDRVVNQNDFNTNSYLKNPYSTIQNNYIQLYLNTKDESYKQEIFKSGELAKNYTVQHLVNLSEQQPSNLRDFTLKYASFENLLDEVSERDFEKTDDITKKNTISRKKINVPETISLDSLRRKLKNNQALISYSEYDLNGHDVKILAHLITKKRDTIFYLTNQFDNFLTAKQNKMNEAAQNNDIELFQKHSNLYYEFLLSPIIQSLNDEVEELTLIQSPKLESLNIDFDALVSEVLPSRSFKNLNYIGRKYAFSYAISASTAYSDKINNKEKQTITIFIPNSEKLPDLIYKDKFIQNIEEKYKIRLYVGEESNKHNFIKHLKEDKIIMVISHGHGSNIDENYSNGIFLNDGFLSVVDIEQMNSNCNLLILAGCSTGVGFSSKDGMINFSRSMTLLGVNSLLLTSHDVDEVSTLTIIENWLEHLAEGRTKSQALQLAKVEYLKNVTSRTTNPKYWSSLKLIGSTDRIYIKEIPKIKSYQYLISVFLIVLLILIIRKLRN